MTRRGKEAVVVLRAEEFERLNPAKPGQSLVEILRRGRLHELDLTRSKDFMREIDL
ncbi:MAG: hypothetical protein SFV18_07600 [Bryobacteraceae bacterium]|nr:hypothetical protein [Bryobacteraceae bacterium]